MRLRLRFWLLVLDLFAACGLFGRAPYLWALRRADRPDGREG